MKIAFFDTHQFEKQLYIDLALKNHHEIVFFETRLNHQTAHLASGFNCVCAFVNDRLDAPTLKILKSQQVQLIALRSAGFNHVDLKVARDQQIKVVRVPEYSPYAVAEHAVALILTLNRKTHKAYNRVRESNFSLDGLVGFDLHGKTVGLIGTGKIGSKLFNILKGFGCHVLGYDIQQQDELARQGLKYVDLEVLLKQSDIISLHVPLNPQTQHIINDKNLKLTKPGVMLINTSRGALVETRALIQSLKSGHLGSAGLDVYEEEAGLFFENLSDQILQDDQLARLLTFPNVLITSHQAFLTREALHNIATTTFDSLHQFEHGKVLDFEVR